MYDPNMPYAVIMMIWTILGVLAVPFLIYVVPAFIMSAWDVLYEGALSFLAQWTEHQNDKVGKHWQFQEEDDNFFLAILQERRRVFAGLEREWSING